MVPGWPPVAWERGCLLIGNGDEPFAEEEERGRKRRLAKPPDALKGWWDFQLIAWTTPSGARLRSL